MPRPDLFSELKRRKVYRVGAAYLAVVFALLQGADLVFRSLAFDSRVFNGLVLLSLLGFPVAVALAWMFDITGEGIRRTAPAGADGVRESVPDRWARAKAGLVGAGFMAVVWFGVHVWQTPELRGDQGMVPSERPTLAVLPFEDLSPGSDQAYFADGLHEELLHQLAILRGLRVTPRTSALHFRGSAATVAAIADSLGVRYVLEGSVRQAGDSIRVRAELIDALSDEPLWSEAYDRALSVDALLGIQRTLAMRLARSLGGTLAGGQAERLERAPTRSLEAYNAFLRGLHAWAEFTGPSVLEAGEEFKHAVDLDPRFGRAHGMLALDYVVQNNFGLGKQGELFPLIREHAGLALRYAPDEPESHMGMASVHWTLEWNWPAALKELETTVELDPAFPDGRWALAEWYGVIDGNTEKGLETIDEAVRLDPFSATAPNLRAFILYVGRRYGEAAEEYRRLVAMAPDEPQNTVNLASNLALSGELPEARRLVDEVLPRLPRPLAPEMAVTLARVDEMDQARQVREDAEARRAAGGSVPASGLAMAAVAVGDLDSALTWLEVCFAEEGGIYYLRDPIWNPLRSDARFQAIWEKVGLPGDPPPSGS